MSEPFIGCTIKQLPPDQWAEAAQVACLENPVNATPLITMAMMSSIGLTVEASKSIPLPDRLAVVTGKMWSAKGVKLGVSFLDDPPADLRKRILMHANAWNKTAKVEFYESASGEIRLARYPGSGHFAYMGTDNLLIRADQQTMNLDSFTMQTSDSEFFRVVRHEFGHVLAFPHEHLRAEIIARIDEQKAIDHFWRTQGWSAQDTRYQVLTPASGIRGSVLTDVQSVMCYWLPGSIMKDGVAVPGGNDINENDYAFAASVYPKPDTPDPKPPPPPVTGWWLWVQQLLAFLRKLLENAPADQKPEIAQQIAELETKMKESQHA